MTADEKKMADAQDELLCNEIDYYLESYKNTRKYTYFGVFKQYVKKHYHIEDEGVLQEGWEIFRHNVDGEMAEYEELDEEMFREWDYICTYG